uniref:Uncharacterized protein n=1 Tax=Pseudourostyla cristata TaxID=293816 RepID=A0A4V1HFN5_9SPIT|nr:hypothetical protein [Pseudourostyla cristata]
MAFFLVFINFIKHYIFNKIIKILKRLHFNSNLTECMQSSEQAKKEAAKKHQETTNSTYGGIFTSTKSSYNCNYVSREFYSDKNFSDHNKKAEYEKYYKESSKASDKDMSDIASAALKGGVLKGGKVVAGKLIGEKGLVELTKKDTQKEIMNQAVKGAKDGVKSATFTGITKDAGFSFWNFLKKD